MKREYAGRERRRSWKNFVITLFVVSLTACSHTQTTDKETIGQETPQKTGQKQDQQTLGDALMTPAEDLNLKRARIPEALKELKHVYSPEHAFTCEEIAAEIIRLSAHLGADDDVPEERRSSASKNAADFTLKAISGITGGLIPFRGLIKKASGAAAHEKKLRNAYLTGLKRRAYLKGLGQSQGCEPPAAPSIPSQEGVLTEP